MPSEEPSLHKPALPAQPSPSPSNELPVASTPGQTANDVKSSNDSNSLGNFLVTLIGVPVFLWLVWAYGLPALEKSKNDFRQPKPDVLEKLIDERKSSQTIETEADRAEYDGRLEDAARLRQKAALRLAEEQAKAARDKDFQEWRRKKYGETTSERK
ncbi:MAG: hypothetical protein C0483_07565 [Pirellula sp.]|nr:hypothetical protein [Pirellula sp.]